MTGWRVGYSFIPLALHKNFRKVSQSTITSVAAFTQYAAAHALPGHDAHKEELIAMYNFYYTRKKELEQLLNDKQVTYFKPNGVFTFL